MNPSARKDRPGFYFEGDNWIREQNRGLWDWKVDRRLPAHHDNCEAAAGLCERSEQCLRIYFLFTFSSWSNDKFPGRRVNNGLSCMTHSNIIQPSLAIAFCWGAPSPLTSMIVWETFKIQKLLIDLNEFIYWLLLYAMLEQCLFLYLTCENPFWVS